MGATTDIQWCDTTVNPTSGCDGCELWIPGRGGDCYAGHIHNRFSPSVAYPGAFERIDLHAGRMARAAALPSMTGISRPGKPWLATLPRFIFVGDMADNFSRDVPLEYLCREVVSVVLSGAGRRHFWLWLTKQPTRMLQLCRDYLDSRWPDNLMAMVSVTSDKTLKRLDVLREIPARYRGVSAEPLLGPLFLQGRLGGMHWLITGGLSGSNQVTRLEALRRVKLAGEEAGVPVFIKQLGATPGGEWGCDEVPPPLGSAEKKWFLKDKKGGDWSEWPLDLKVREMPVLHHSQ